MNKPSIVTHYSRPNVGKIFNILEQRAETALNFHKTKEIMRSLLFLSIWQWIKVELDVSHGFMLNHSESWWDFRMWRLRNIYKWVIPSFRRKVKSNDALCFEIKIVVSWTSPCRRGENRVCTLHISFVETGKFRLFVVQFRLIEC